MRRSRWAATLAGKCWVATNGSSNSLYLAIGEVPEACGKR